MKIIALVKQVPDTWADRNLDTATGRLDRDGSDAIFDEIDERALEAALKVKDALGAEVVVMTMGPASAQEVLRRGLAMGADSAVHILAPDLAGSDLARTARVLADAARELGFDLVVAGNESTDGRGGVVPAMIAEHLGIPHATNLDDVEVTASEVTGRRWTEFGGIDVSATLPAVISMTERSSEPRFPNFSGIMKAKKKPLAIVEPSSAPAGARSTVTSVQPRPARVAGVRITDEGDAGRKLAEFLVANRLV